MENTKTNYKINMDEINFSSSDSYDEDLYRDDEDYENLMKLPELQRETILFDRAERRRHHQSRKIAKEILIQIFIILIK